MLKYSIIVPTYNSESTIVQCIESLLVQNCERVCYEIIVVDDGSQDNTGSYVKKYSEVRYLYQKNQGPARARNFGVEQARGEIILFIDADCEATPNWLREMVKPFDNKEIIGVKGTYLSKQKKIAARFVQMEYESKYEKMKHDQYIDFIDTYSAAFRKQAFMAAGGYDDSIFTNASVEDQEFSFRLAANQCKLVFNPDAKVYHHHVDNIKDYFKKKFKIGFWKVLVLKRHPGKMLRDSHTPQTLKIEIFLTVMVLAWMSVLFFIHHPTLYIAGGTGIVMYIALMIYEMRIHWKNSPAMVLYSLIMIFIRSIALGGGLILGILKLIRWKNILLMVKKQ